MKSRRVTCPPEVSSAADKLAVEIIEAFEQLPTYVGTELAFDMVFDDEPLLGFIGEALFSLDTDRAEELASQILFDTFLGWSRPTVMALSDAPPWGVIRRGILELLALWHEFEPSFRDWHEWREHMRRRRPA